MSGCVTHIARALEISEEILDLADDASQECSHDGCLILDGILRDCAYKIRMEADRALHALESRMERDGYRLGA